MANSSDAELIPGRWYWVRRRDGSLAPYRLHQVDAGRAKRTAQFFVGSFLQTWPLSSVIAEAAMPNERSKERNLDDET